MNPILKRAAMVTAAVVIADQALKIWVKTHLFIGEGSYTNWGVGISQLQLKFVEDPAMPIALSIFRLLAIGGIVLRHNILAVRQFHRNDSRNIPRNGRLRHIPARQSS